MRRGHIIAMGAGLLVMGTMSTDGAQESLEVLPRPATVAAAPGMLETHLKRLAYAAADDREKRYEAVKTPEDVRAWQARTRDYFHQQLGPWPARTPLNARVTGRLQGEGFHVEKVLYESLPGFHVSAALYLPSTPPPYPGVLFPCGHSENGKAAEAYQRACILLARNGMAVLCFDPIGQGERKQVLDDAGKGRFGPTTEHALVAPGAILLGRNVATTMVWDGMRGLDYLASRPEVDAKRLGCTGNSGGGTQTSYLMALDPRIVAAAPGCYLTTFRRLLETIGPQDPEQNIYGQIAFGMDHADYALMHAPQPTLMCVATRDFFDISGAWQTYRQAKRIYGRLGFPERMDLAETDDTHGFTRNLRVAATRWMRRWLLGKDDAVTEPDFPIFTDAELQCTPRGQVILMDNERTVFDLNRAEAEAISGARRRRWTGATPTERQEIVRRRAGIRPAAQLTAPAADEAGSAERGDLKIRKRLLHLEPGLSLPALDFAAVGPAKGLVLYLHGEGKAKEAGSGGEIERRAREGFRVLALDLGSLGETRGRNARGEPAGSSERDATLAYLLARSLVGMRAEEILRAARLLRDEGGALPLHLVAVGETGVSALHAAAVAPAWFASVRVSRSLRSWQDVLKSNAPTGVRSHLVHGALQDYDLTDLAATLGRNFTITDPTVP